MLDAFALLDRDVDETAVLGPRAVVVTNVPIAEKIGENEPGVAGALPDPAVGDDVLISSEALVGVERLQLVDRFERPVGLRRGSPRDVARPGDVPGALGALLRVADRVQ